MCIRMSVTLQKCNYALPYVPICHRLLKWLPSTIHGLLLQFSANTVIASREPISTAPFSGLRTVPIIDCTIWYQELSQPALA